MVVKIFVLGCPGSGKSTAAHKIVEKVSALDNGWEAFHISDYIILHDLFKTNREPQKFVQADHDGFNVLDKSIYNQALKSVKTVIQNEEKRSANKQIIVVEFARFDYKASMQLLGKDFIQEAYFLFVKAEVATCEQRIWLRIINPATIDDHFVSNYVLESYQEREKTYLENTLHYLKDDYGIDHSHIHVIQNTADCSMQDFSLKTEEFVSFVMEKEKQNTVDEQVPNLYLPQSRPALQETTYERQRVLILEELVSSSS